MNIVALASFFRFELDTDFLSLFTSGNPKTEEYDRLNEKYQSRESIVVLIEQEDSLLTTENIHNVFDLEEAIEKINGVSRVQSFIPAEVPVNGRVYEVDRKFIENHPDLLEDFIRDRYFI